MCARDGQCHKSLSEFQQCTKYNNSNNINVFLSRSLTWNDRIDKIMSWIKDEKRPANLILAYFEEPDRTSHMVIGSHEVQDQISRVDATVK